MDRMTLKKTYRWPSPSRGRSSQQSGVSWTLPFSTASPSPASPGSCDSLTISESGSPCESSESSSEPDLGKPGIDSGAPVIETTGQEAGQEGTPLGGPIESPATTTTRVGKDADRLQSLFSEYEKVIRGQTESRRRSVSAHQGNETLEPNCLEPQDQMLSEAITAREQPQVTHPRRSQRRRKAVPRATQHRVQKKRASAISSGEFEFLRLGQARQASNGSIEYKVMWKPTWVTIGDLRGERALEEAEDLTVNEFDQATWEREMRRSGYLDMDTESE